jgi:hypothetical protein
LRKKNGVRDEFSEPKSHKKQRQKNSSLTPFFFSPIRELIRALVMLLAPDHPAQTA